MPELMQDIAHEFSAIYPDIVWRDGKSGALDGFWTQTGSTFVTILPLALIGAAGAANADQRASEFSKASDGMLLAFGAAPEKLAALREAQQQGSASLAKAVEDLLATRDPHSPGARAAVEELVAEQESQRLAQQVAEMSGRTPGIRRAADGSWEVYDGRTRKEIGKAATMADALAMASAQRTAQEDEQALLDAGGFRNLPTEGEAPPGEMSVSGGMEMKRPPRRTGTPTGMTMDLYVSRSAPAAAAMHRSRNMSKSLSAC